MMDSGVMEKKNFLKIVNLKSQQNNPRTTGDEVLDSGRGRTCQKKDQKPEKEAATVSNLPKNLFDDATFVSTSLVAGKSQLTADYFTQFYRNFQGHEVGLGIGVGQGQGQGWS